MTLYTKYSDNYRKEPGAPIKKRAVTLSGKHQPVISG